MTLALAFWVLMLVWFAFHAWADRGNVGGWLQFLLFLLLGWKVFGAPIHG